jgi:glutathione S-transferase
VEQTDGGEQKKAEYLAINPSQMVPALQIDGHVLGQSVAILEYLEETRPTLPLLPKDPFLRCVLRVECDFCLTVQRHSSRDPTEYNLAHSARVRQIVNIIAAGFISPFSDRPVNVVFVRYPAVAEFTSAQ